MKVGVTELQEQLEISEEAGVSIRQVAQLAMNENGQKIFDIFWARRRRGMYRQKGLVELERWCPNTMQQVQVLSERQEVLKKKKKYDGRQTWTAEHSHGKAL